MCSSDLGILRLLAVGKDALDHVSGVHNGSVQPKQPQKDGRHRIHAWMMLIEAIDRPNEGIEMRDIPMHVILRKAGPISVIMEENCFVWVA